MPLKTETVASTGYIRRRVHEYEYSVNYLGQVTVTHDAYPYNSDTRYDTSRSVTKDITHRDWRKLIRTGSNATTSLSGNIDKLHVSPGYVFSRKRQNAVGQLPRAVTETTCEGGLILVGKPTGVGSVSTVVADNKAKAAFISRCRSLQTSFQGMQFLGEGRETLHMLRGNVKDVKKLSMRYLNDVKRLVKGYSNRTSFSRDLDKIRRIIGNRYLEWTFGMKPLYHDMVSIGEAVARMSLNPPKDFKLVSATASDKSYVESGLTTWIPAGTLRIVSSTRSGSAAIVTYRGVVGAGLNSEFNAQNIGFTPSMFVPTLWELLPYSWLADYVTNIGQIIDAVSFNRSSLRWVSRTIVQQKTNRLASFDCWDSATGYTNEVLSVLKPSVSWDCRLVSRSTYGGSLVPDFRFTLDNLNWHKGLNIAAVALQGNRLQKFIHHFL